MMNKKSRKKLYTGLFIVFTSIGAFPGLKRIHRSRLDINKNTLNFCQQVFILDYLDQGKAPGSEDVTQPSQDFLYLKEPYLGQKLLGTAGQYRRWGK